MANSYTKAAFHLLVSAEEAAMLRRNAGADGEPRRVGERAHHGEELDRLRPGAENNENLHDTFS